MCDSIYLKLTIYHGIKSQDSGYLLEGTWNWEGNRGLSVLIMLFPMEIVTLMYSLYDNSSSGTQDFIQFAIFIFELLGFWKTT